MDDMQISDADIAAMSAQQRRELITRLARAGSAVISTPQARRMRRRRLAVNILAPFVLLPWIVYLATSLPDHYVARNWAAAWVGFDVLLLVMFAVTAVFGLLRRQLLLLSAFGTGLLLICDAWFDVLTAAPSDRWPSVASAVLVELPVAAMLINSALRLMRATAMRLSLLEPGQPLWRVPLPVA
jgi:hypothetical protein